MANTIVATVDTATASVSLFVQFDGATNTEALVERTIDGGVTWVAVRGGDPLGLIGADPGALTRTGYLTDTEMPLDVAVQYRATSNGTSTVVTSAVVTVDSDGYSWLKDPARPWADVRLDPCETPQQACAEPTEPAVTAVLLGDEAYDADATLMPVLNRSRPGDVYAFRKDAETSATFVSKTLDAATTMNIFWAWGGPILLQLPPEWGWADRYYQPGQVTASRLSGRDNRKPYRLWGTPLTVVDAPVGPAQGTAENNWCTVADCYATYADFVASGLTWGDVMEGDAAC